MLFKINKVNNYTFSEFKEIRKNQDLVKEELILLTKLIGYIKRNKELYIKVGVTTTSILIYDTTLSFAGGVSDVYSNFD